MKKVIFDCDNTMAITGYPMDDALAFLYLCGKRDMADVLGFTCTFGNGTVAEVQAASRSLLEEVGLADEMSFFAGAESGADARTNAAHFIVEKANQYPGEVTFLGIGSVTNLYGTYLLDEQIFDKLEQVVLMGGITEPLYTHGKLCPELNFSINNEASAVVLSKGKRVSVISGNNCLGVCYLPKSEFVSRMAVDSNPVGAYIAEKCGYRFENRKAVYGEEGSYCWDVVAAAYVLHPELFRDEYVKCNINAEDLKSGFLSPCADGDAVLNLPKVIDVAAFRENIYAGWQNVKLPQKDEQ